MVKRRNKIQTEKKTEREEITLAGGLRGGLPLWEVAESHFLTNLAGTFNSGAASASGQPSPLGIIHTYCIDEETEVQTVTYLTLGVKNQIQRTAWAVSIPPRGSSRICSRGALEEPEVLNHEKLLPWGVSKACDCWSNGFCLFVF